MPNISQTTYATCETCGKALTGRKKRFCSRACYFASGPVVLQGKNPTIEYKGITYRQQNSGYYQSHKPYSLLHHVIWEENFGPIPKGYLVHHKDGNHSNNAQDNLQLVTFSELRPHKPKLTCLKCDRPARSRGLCARHYSRLNFKERGDWRAIGATATSSTRSSCAPSAMRMIAEKLGLHPSAITEFLQKERSEDHL